MPVRAGQHCSSWPCCSEPCRGNVESLKWYGIGLGFRHAGGPVAMTTNDFRSVGDGVRGGPCRHRRWTGRAGSGRAARRRACRSAGAWRRRGRVWWSQRAAASPVSERRQPYDGGAARDRACQAAARAQDPRPRGNTRFRPLVHSAGREDGRGDGQEDWRVDDGRDLRRVVDQRSEPQTVPT